MTIKNVIEHVILQLFLYDFVVVVWLLNNYQFQQLNIFYLLHIFYKYLHGNLININIKFLVVVVSLYFVFECIYKIKKKSYNFNLSPFVFLNKISFFFYCKNCLTCNVFSIRYYIVILSNNTYIISFSEPYLFSFILQSIKFDSFFNFFI